mgnify:CR=1 FL=1
MHTTHLKIFRACVSAAFVAGLLCSAAPAAPIIGEYASPTTGNDMLNGRWSESWLGGQEGAIGNTINAASWDEANLGTEWEMFGMSIAASPTVDDNRDANGNGTVTYRTSYDGGQMLLKDTGAWWGGGSGSEYVVDLGGYEHTTVKVYVEGQEVAATTTIYSHGVFQGYGGIYEVSFVTAVAVPDGSGPLAPDYPEYLPAGETTGAYGHVQKIRMEIIPEPATMGLLAMGGLALLRRRRR